VVNMESTYYNVVAPAGYGGLSKFQPKGYTKKEVSLTSFLLFLGVFGEYCLIGERLCCRLRELGVLFV
jgi:hypothetical protein